MNKEDAETLKPGERVCIFAGEPTVCSGTIVACNEHGVEIKWDDGRTGVVFYSVMLDVERYGWTTSSTGGFDHIDRLGTSKS